jgi:hypothetical protein
MPKPVIKRLDSSSRTPRVVELPLVQYIAALTMQAAAPYVAAEVAAHRALARRLDRALELARSTLPDTFDTIAADRRALLVSDISPDQERAARAALDGRFVRLMAAELTELRK